MTPTPPWKISPGKTVKIGSIGMDMVCDCRQSWSGIMGIERGQRRSSFGGTVSTAPTAGTTETVGRGSIQQPCLHKKSLNIGSPGRGTHLGWLILWGMFENGVTRKEPRKAAGPTAAQRFHEEAIFRAMRVFASRVTESKIAK